MSKVLPVETVHQIGARGLYNLAQRGILAVVMTTENIPTSREETPEYKKFSHLKGVGISINAGARKYNLHSSTVTRWVHKNLIAKVGTEKNRVLIDEADLAYCAEVQSNRPGQGKWLFDQKGLPYIPETPG
jgi:hypothetical protein